MDKNTIFGLVLILALVIGYSYYTAPSKEDLEIARMKNDSIAMLQRTQEAANLEREQERNRRSEQRSVETSADNRIIDGTIDSTTIKMNVEKLGVFSNAGIGKEKLFLIENDLMKVRVSSKGGRVHSVELKDFQTFDSLPLFVFENKDSRFDLSFYANNRVISSGDLFFQPIKGNNAYSSDSMYVKGDSLRFSMRIYADGNENTINKRKYIDFVYSVKPGSYILDYHVVFVGMEDVVSQYDDVNLFWIQHMQRQEKSLKNERINATIYYKDANDEEVDYLSETKDEKESLTSSIKWIGFKQQFFTSVLIAQDNFSNVKIWTETDEENEKRPKSMFAQAGFQYKGESEYTFPMKFYFGPNRYNLLKTFNLDLERQIPLGWGPLSWINKYAVIPVFHFLEGFNFNYGIIILLLTIILKLVLFPIAYKTYISSAKMRVLKPEIDEIGKKFPKQDEAMKKQQATMALYKKAGVNPMAGCVPMLLQLPILIALFRFFPASIELRQKAFLWADDLSSYDSIFDLPFDIPFYGDHISLFTLLMTVSTIIYTKVNNEMMGQTNQMPGMKMMMYIMPVMFLGIFNNYASGLSYYYFLANIITFLQMFLIRKFVNEEKIHKQVQANKEKKGAAKKSGFQKRLEEMAKQKGYKK